MTWHIERLSRGHSTHVETSTSERRRRIRAHHAFLRQAVDAAVEKITAARIEAAPVLKIVRAKCVDCCGGSEREVRFCVAVTCPLWALRMGSNPFRALASAERKAQLAERLAKARTKRSDP
jgi:hypothetical protein